MAGFSWLKRYMPRKFFARALLILFVPVIGIQLVVAVVFIQRHFEAVTRQMASSVGAELSYVIATLESGDAVAPDEDQLRRTAELLGYSLEFLPGEQVQPGRTLLFLDVSGREMARTLESALSRPLAIDTAEIHKAVRLDIQLATGVLTAVIPRRRVIVSNPHLLLGWMVVTSALLATISVLFLRNQVRPLRELASAAQAFGKGQTVRFRPRGAEEVRRAGAAFMAMRQRIDRQIESRTTMLSGVSHDLRTPLTRMRLALAVSDPGPETDELRHDVSEMERMLEGFLAFARGDGTEATTEVSAPDLVRRIVHDARRTGADITLALHDETPMDPLVPMREMAIGRAIANLVGNAARYAGRQRVTLRLTPQAMEVTVEDDGPGIDAARREEALKPFARLDAARNQDDGGGVGLGLSISADVARSHGGSLVLGESEYLGGLAATLRIPR